MGTVFAMKKHLSTSTNRSMSLEMDDDAHADAL